jgi:toxin ParE1/3/4
MRIVFTDEALRDLDEILEFIATHYPAIALPFRQRLRAVLQRIGKWPKSGEEVEQRPGVHVAPLIRYPYRIFYQTTTDAVEILHIHHAARRPPWSEKGNQTDR